MSFKDEGRCPFCKESMTPDVLEENNLRRDKCKCTKCERFIYICRAPGCREYARGGDAYDDEFCIQCSDKIAAFGRDAAEKLSGAVVLGGAALITAWMAKQAK